MNVRIIDIVTFWRKTETNTGRGLTSAWSEIGRSRAGRVDAGVSEGQAAGTIAAQISARFLVLRNSVTMGLTPADALQCRGQTFGIIGIRDADRRRQRAASTFRRSPPAKAPSPPDTSRYIRAGTA